MTGIPTMWSPKSGCSSSMHHRINVIRCYQILVPVVLQSAAARMAHRGQWAVQYKVAARTGLPLLCKMDDGERTS